MDLLVLAFLLHKLHFRSCKSKRHGGLYSQVIYLLYYDCLFNPPQFSHNPKSLAKTPVGLVWSCCYGCQVLCSVMALDRKYVFMHSRYSELEMPTRCRLRYYAFCVWPLHMLVVLVICFSLQPNCKTTSLVFLMHSDALIKTSLYWNSVDLKYWMKWCLYQLNMVDLLMKHDVGTGLCSKVMVRLNMAASPTPPKSSLSIILIFSIL